MHYRSHATVFLALATLALTACPPALKDALSPYTPKLSFKRLALKSLDFQSISVDFLFDLHNPNPLSVKLARFGYHLGLEGTEVVRGTNESGVKLESRGDTELAIPLSMTFAELFKLVGAVKGKDELGFALGG